MGVFFGLAAVAILNFQGTLLLMEEREVGQFIEPNRVFDCDRSGDVARDAGSVVGAADGQHVGARHLSALLPDRFQGSITAANLPMPLKQ
jgi:hypothetical protein